MIKYIGLILSLLSTIFSFLFFARKQDTYLLLLIGGLLMSFIFFLTILFGKHHWKNKLVWTFVVLSAIGIQRISEEYSIKSSYLIFLNSDKQKLLEVEEIMNNHNEELFMYNDEIKDNEKSLTEAERIRLLELRKQLGVYIIDKSNEGIYFGLWGLLDVRHGITLIRNNKTVNPQLKKLSNNWYY